MDVLLEKVISFCADNGIGVSMLCLCAYYFYRRAESSEKKVEALQTKFDEFVTKEHAEMVRNVKDWVRVVETNNFVLQRVERKLDELGE